MAGVQLRSLQAEGIGNGLPGHPSEEKRLARVLVFAYVHIRDQASTRDEQCDESDPAIYSLPEAGRFPGAEPCVDEIFTF